MYCVWVLNKYIRLNSKLYKTQFDVFKYTSKRFNHINGFFCLVVIKNIQKREIKYDFIASDKLNITHIHHRNNESVVSRFHYNIVLIFVHVAGSIIGYTQNESIKYYLQIKITPSV